MQYQRAQISRTAMLLAVGAAMLAPLVATEAQAQAWDMYQGYSQSQTIPFANTLPYTDVVSGQHSLSVKAHIGSSSTATQFTVDTGSTGIAVSADLLPNFSASGTMGWVFYNSSNLLSVGYFTNTQVNYVDGSGNVVATANVPVLGVTQKFCLADTKCQGMVTGGATGTGATNNAIAMMGVGINRNSMGIVSDTGALGSYLPSTGGYLDSTQAAPILAALNGAPAISQAYNPLVNITGMGDTMRRGYIIGPTGIQVGLTSSNTSGFSFQNLAPSPAGSYSGVTGSANNWMSATMSVTGSGGGKSGSAPGEFLPDTGLNNAYLYLPGTSLPHGPNAAGQTVYDNGVTVTLSLLGGVPGTYYSFTIGGDSPYAPTSMGLGLPPKGHPELSYMNSGLHFYGAFNYLYDADGGYVGYSPGPLFNSSYAGFTQVLAASGTLSLSDPLTVLVPTFLIDQATIQTSSTAIFNAPVTGPGGLTVAGGGTVALNAVNNYAGGTTVSSGMLALNGSLMGAMAVAQGATFLNGGTYATQGAAFTNAGAFTNNGTVTGDLTNTGSAANNASGVIDGAVINSGSFNNAGKITGQFTNSGTLSGNGTVGSLVAQSGSGVAPGNSVGVIRVTGDAVFAAGSTHLVDIGPNGDADLVQVDGRAHLAGNIQTQAMAGFTPTLGASYTILTAAGGVSGAYATLQGNLFSPTAYPFMTTALAHGPNAVSLDIVRSNTTYASAGVTPNHVAVANAIESLPTGTELHQAVSRLNTQTAPLAFHALHGSIYASAQSVMQQQSTYVRDILGGRLRQASDATSPTQAASAPRTVPGLTATLWGAAFGGWGNSKHSANATSLHRTIGGFMAGIDAPLDTQWRIGLAGGYSNSTLKDSNRAASGNIDNYTVAAYGSGSFGAVNLRFGGAYTWHDLSVGRIITFPGLSSVAGSNLDAGTVQVFGEASYRIDLGSARIDPYVGLAYVNVSTDAFHERFSPVALQGRSDAQANTYSALGLRASYSMPVAQGVLTARATLAWQHAFGDVTPDTLLSFARTATPFSVAGVPIARNAALVGARLDYAATENLTVSLAYDGQLATDVQENAVRAAVAWRF